jgi:hypothetical protein
MKKQILSFVMMLTLVVVAGKTFGAIGDKFNPFPGGTYSYTLPYTLVNNGEVTLTLSTGMTIGTTTPSGLTSGGAAVSLASGTDNIVLPITYDAAATGLKTITIVIKDNTSGCSNNIHLDVTMASIPTLALAVNGSVTDLCQNLNSSPASNVDATVGAAANTFTFTVTPTVNIASGYTYDFLFDLDSYVLGATDVTIQRTTGDGTATPSGAVGSQIAITGATSASQVFTVTFATTSGQPNTTYTGTASVAKLNVVLGGQTYNGTPATPNASVTVKAMPTIGTFN